MRRPSLLRGVLFALIAGLGVLLWLVVAGPVLGYPCAAAWYGLGLLPWYTLAVAPSWRLGVRAALLAAALAVPAAVFARGPMFVVGLTPFVLGIVRSALLFPRPFARALFLELGCGVLAIALAAFSTTPASVGTTFAIWAFWLVQAGFALAPGEPAVSAESTADLFEAARARALAVLERRP